MVYRQTIVSYDIEDNKTRTRLRKDLIALGLVPVQKSVLWGYLNATEEKAVLGVLGKLGLDKDDSPDSAFLVHADLETAIGKTTFGISRQLFLHPDDDRIV